MSYHAFGDNEDLNSLPDDAYERLVPLGNLIEASHLEGYHQEACGCREETCWTRENHGRPSTEEVLGWLVAKGLLDLGRAEEAVRATAHVHTDDRMCVLVPMEVEGARECFYCGGHTGGPCGDRCETARAEVTRRG